MITGVTSVAVEDIRAQLRDAEGDIDLVVRRVPMNSPGEVAHALRESTDANLIILTRGGGHEVAGMDDDELIEAVAQAPTLTATALGHASD